MACYGAVYIDPGVRVPSFGKTQPSTVHLWLSTETHAYSNKPVDIHTY